MDSLEKRAFEFDVRAEHDEEKGDIIVGRPIVYEKPTDISGMYEEVICAGALDGADLRDVRFLVNHDLNKIPLARSRRNNGNSTMQLDVDKDGMAIRVSLDTENNADARALYSAVRRGDISGMSFMFGIDKQRWENLKSDYPKRYVEKISTVVEVSAVTFPAYNETSISARNKEALENAKRAVDTARSSAQTAGEKKKPDEELKLMKLKNQILGGI